MMLEIQGVRPPDERWKKMKAIYDACKDAGIDPPGDVLDFFNDEDPDPHGLLVRMGQISDGDNYVRDAHVSVRMYNPHETAMVGFKVDLSKIPDHVTHLVFTWTY